VGETAKDGKCLVALKVRGTVRARREARETLKMLRLTKTNHAVLVSNNPSFLGMLKAAQGYVTWGEISKATLDRMMKRRGRLEGNKKLTEEYAQKIGYKSLDDLAQAVFSCNVEYWKLPHVQPVFKLPPPTKGYKGTTKKGYGMGGELGYRGEKINELIQRMI
jgi:large subunit ribosomal protein L30